MSGDDDVEAEAQATARPTDEDASLLRREEDGPNRRVVGAGEMGSLSGEIGVFARIAAPNSLVAVFMFFQFTFSMVIGSKYLGVEEMSAITLASLFSNLSGLTIIYGLLSAMDTLAPQSFGAGNYGQLSVLAARGVLFVYCTLPLTLLVWWNAESLLLAVGQPKHESRLAGVFLRFHFLTLPGLTLWEVGRRFLWAQSHVSQWPFVLISFAALVFHLVMLHVLVPTLGFKGVPMVHSLTVWWMVLLLGLWMWCFKPYRTQTLVWPQPKDVLNPDGVRLFLRLGLPGILANAEWVYFELFIFAAGELGTIALAANSIAYSLIPICFTVPLGLQVGLTTRVGHMLAQGQPSRARELVVAVMSVALAMAVFVALLVFWQRDNIISQYSDNTKVAGTAKSIWTPLSMFLVLDATFGCQSGIMRSLSLQAYFSGVVFVSLFLLGLPTVLVLGFAVKWGIVGLWIGFPAPYVLLNLLMWRKWRSFDFDALSKEVMAREGRLKAVAVVP